MERSSPDKIYSNEVSFVDLTPSIITSTGSVTSWSDVGCLLNHGDGDITKLDMVNIYPIEHTYDTTGVITVSIVCAADSTLDVSDFETCEVSRTCTRISRKIEVFSRSQEYLRNVSGGANIGSDSILDSYFLSDYNSKNPSPRRVYSYRIFLDDGTSSPSIPSSHPQSTPLALEADTSYTILIQVYNPNTPEGTDRDEEAEELTKMFHQEGIYPRVAVTASSLIPVDDCSVFNISTDDDDSYINSAPILLSPIEKSLFGAVGFSGRPPCVNSDLHDDINAWKLNIKTSVTIKRAPILISNNGLCIHGSCIESLITRVLVYQQRSVEGTLGTVLDYSDTDHQAFIDSSPPIKTFSIYNHPCMHEHLLALPVAKSPSDVVDGTYGDYSSLLLFESLSGFPSGISLSADDVTMFDLSRHFEDDVLPLLDDDTIDTNTSITNKQSICYGLTPQLCSTMRILDLSILADGSIFFVTSRGLVLGRLVVGKSLINFAKTIQSMVFYPLTATGHYTLNKRELIYGWNEIDLDTGLNFFPRVYVHSNFKCSVDGVNGCADTILHEDSEEIDGFWSGDTSEVSSLADLSLSQAATLFGSRYVTISLQRSNGGSVDFSIGDLRPVWVTPEEDVQPASWVVQSDPASLVDPLLLDVYFLQDNAVTDSGIYDYDYAIYLSPFSSFSIPVISATIPDDGIMAVTSSTTNNLYIITGVKDDSSVANALLQCNLTYISSFPVSSFLTSSSYGFSDSNAWEVVSTGEIYDARSIHLNRDGVGVTIVGSKVYSGYLTGEHMDMTSLSSTSDDPVIKIQQEPLSNVPVVESVRYREGGGGSYG
ncbi:hypothetical protein ADUPG1_008695, partial [Aduncisulcus paluster]